MKKRIIKKYVNRYITPVIKGLPTTEYGAFHIEENGKIKVIGKNHTIVNGEVKGEATMHNGCQDILRNIRLTGSKAKEIINEYKEVRLRTFQIRGNFVRMRLITE